MTLREVLHNNWSLYRNFLCVGITKLRLAKMEVIYRPTKISVSISWMKHSVSIKNTSRLASFKRATTWHVALEKDGDHLDRSREKWINFMHMVPCIADINNCPTKCNTKQAIYYSASSLYMFRVSTKPIISSTQNCNYSLRYCAATSLQSGQASLATLEGGSCTKLWPVPEAVVTVLCPPDYDWPRWREVAAQKLWPVPEAVVTVLCTPDYDWPRWREVAAQKIWPVPEAVVTVLCTPDDGCGWHPKHVEWTCKKMNRLLCVASRWTIININEEVLQRLKDKQYATRNKRKEG